MRSLLAVVGVLVLVAWGISRGQEPFPPDVLESSIPPAEPIEAPGVERDVAVYEGLGTWVDIFDIDAGRTGGTPPVTPDALTDMAGVGVRTLYLQAADESMDEPGVFQPDLTGEFLVKAHAAGVRVVGWFVPRHGDVERDLAFLEAVTDFEYEGHRFDGVALDIEWTQTEPDPAARSAATVELAAQASEFLGDEALGAIVLEPLLVEDVNPNLWPDYPYADLAGSVDVFLPMSYWTNRTASSGLRDGFVYTAGNVEGLRAHVGEGVSIHVIGGVGDATTPDDLQGFATAAFEQKAVGLSLYDWNTTLSSAWDTLRGPAS